jgi:hypothetical protein
MKSMCTTAGCQDSKPAWINRSQYPISEKHTTKRAGGVAQDVGLEFKPRTAKEEKVHVYYVSPTKQNRVCVHVYIHVYACVTERVRGI